MAILVRKIPRQKVKPEFLFLADIFISKKIIFCPSILFLLSEARLTFKIFKKSVINVKLIYFLG
jgi:hypothetical protein